MRELMHEEWCRAVSIVSYGEVESKSTKGDAVHFPIVSYGEAESKSTKGDAVHFSLLCLLVSFC